MSRLASFGTDIDRGMVDLRRSCESFPREAFSAVLISKVNWPQKVQGRCRRRRFRGNGRQPQLARSMARPVRKGQKRAAFHPLFARHDLRVRESQTGPRSRDNVVKYRLKPILAKLGIPSRNVGLHAFRHGLATELADASVPLPVLQSQMRHADVRTTLRTYSHVFQQSHRDAMERTGQALTVQIVPFSTASAA